MAKVSLTHLDKMFWPKEGFTKGDVIRYYDRVADVILPYLAQSADGPQSASQRHQGCELFPKECRPASSAAVS